MLQSIIHEITYSSIFIKLHPIYAWHSARCMGNETQDPAFGELTVAWRKQTHWQILSAALGQCYDRGSQREQRRGSGKSSHRKWHFADQLYTDCKVRRPTVLSLAVAWTVFLLPHVWNGDILSTLTWLLLGGNICTHHWAWNRINNGFPWWNCTLLPLRLKVGGT